ncbi:hypothetical protein [Moorena sp. SIOASIH]|uniref:hypothetical protein n=1 Tax=Moorena sp. SIOASIH TaxID=2607817 RepID=UPI0025D3DEE4|nr:hypothetical protein [Moorena sp. SIOASIH]
MVPKLIFLDTNVYIIGAIQPESPENMILQWLGWEVPNNNPVGVVISKELIDQISRVAKRLKNKDWSGKIIGRIWQNLNVCYVQVDDYELAKIEALGIIPREAEMLNHDNYVAKIRHTTPITRQIVSREHHLITP